MKTIEQFYSEAMKNEILADEVRVAIIENRLAEILTKHEVDGTAEEFEAFVKEKECGSRELSDEELESASGGKVVNMYANGKEGFYEVFDEGVDVTEIPAPREWIKSSNLYSCPNCRKQYRINVVKLRDHRELFIYCFGVSGSDALYCPDCRPKQKLILTKEEVHMKA